MMDSRVMSSLMPHHYRLSAALIVALAASHAGAQSAPNRYQMEPVPGVSVVAAPLAGALAMPWPRFIAYGLVAASAWTVLFLGAGMLFSTDVQQLGNALDGEGVLAGVLMSGLMAALVE